MNWNKIEGHLSIVFINERETITILEPRRDAEHGFTSGFKHCLNLMVDFLLLLDSQAATTVAKGAYSFYLCLQRF